MNDSFPFNLPPLTSDQLMYKGAMYCELSRRRKGSKGKKESRGLCPLPMSVFSRSTRDEEKDEMTTIVSFLFDLRGDKVYGKVAIDFRKSK